MQGHDRQGQVDVHEECDELTSRVVRQCLRHETPSGRSCNRHAGRCAHGRPHRWFIRTAWLANEYAGWFAIRFSHRFAERFPGWFIQWFPEWFAEWFHQRFRFVLTIKLVSQRTQVVAPYIACAAALSCLCPPLQGVGKGVSIGLHRRERKLTIFSANTDGEHSA